MAVPAAGARRPGRPAPSAPPAGFAGRVTLTAPLATLTRLADRPGELAGLGPVDPWLARDLATAAARNPKTHLVRDRHRRARPRHRARLRPPRTQESQEARRSRPQPGFAFTPASRDGPPAATAPGGCAPPATGRT